MPDPTLPELPDVTEATRATAATLARLEARIHAENTAATLARLEERIHAHEQLVAAQLDTLRTTLEAQGHRTMDALAAADRAVTKAEAANEVRFAGVNAFRAQLTDQAARFATRETIDVIANATRERLDTLTSANRDLINQTAERVRSQLEDVKAQSTRLLVALGTTIIGTLIAALAVEYARR